MSSEGFRFVTETLRDEFKEQFPEETKELEDLAEKFGDGSLEYKSGDVPDTNDFNEFPENGRGYVVTYHPISKKEIPLALFNFKIEMDDSWWRHREERAYETPIKNVKISNIEIKNESGIYYFTGYK